MMDDREVFDIIIAINKRCPNTLWGHNYSLCAVELYDLTGVLILVNQLDIIYENARYSMHTYDMYYGKWFDELIDLFLIQ